MIQAKNILVVDTETGGLSPEECGLVSVCMKVLNSDAMISFHIQKNPHLVYAEAAMNINGVSESTMRDGLTELEAVQTIASFITKNFNAKPCLLGQNVQFDIAFLEKLFERQNVSFRNYCTHYTRDTKTTALFLQDAGVLDPMMFVSLTSLYKKLCGKDPIDAHTAQGDVLMTEAVYNELCMSVQQSI